MSDFNRIFLSGRAVADPEIRYTPAGSEVAQFRIAVNRNYKTKGSNEWQEETFFVTIVAWNNVAAKVEKNLKKGDSVIVEGRVRIREYEVDGNKRSAFEVIANSVRIIKKVQMGEEVVAETADEDVEPNVPFS